MSDSSTDTSMENILNSIKQIIAEDDENRLQVMKETKEYYESQGKTMEDMSHVVPASALASLESGNDKPSSASSLSDNQAIKKDQSAKDTLKQEKNSSDDQTMSAGAPSSSDSQIPSGDPLSSGDQQPEGSSSHATQENVDAAPAKESLPQPEDAFSGNDSANLSEGMIQNKTAQDASPLDDSLGRNDTLEDKSQIEPQNQTVLDQEAGGNHMGDTFDMSPSRDGSVSSSVQGDDATFDRDALSEEPLSLGEVSHTLNEEPLALDSMESSSSTSDDDILDLGSLSEAGDANSSAANLDSFSFKNESSLLHNAGSVNKVMDTQGENTMNDFNNNNGEDALDLGGAMDGFGKEAMDLGDPLDLSSVKATEPLDVSSSFKSAQEPGEAAEREGDSLLSQQAAMAGVSAFRELERSVRVGYAGETLEDVIKGLVRPMLQSWLDNNLPRIVEELVEQEIQNMVGSARGKR